jgi:hypothetical protein
VTPRGSVTLGRQAVASEPVRCAAGSYLLSTGQFADRSEEQTVLEEETRSRGLRMARRSYTDEQRSDALKLYQAVGPAEAGRRLGIPSTTVRQWAKRAGASSPRAEHVRAAVEGAKLTWEQRRAELTDKLGEAAEEFLAKARDANPSNAAFFARALDVVLKNANLLSGDPTERVAVSDLEREIQRELEALAAARARNAERVTADGDGDRS